MSWRKAANGEIPENAVVGGYNPNGDPIYIARAPHQGGTHIGELLKGDNKVNISYGGKVFHYPEYEVFVASPKEMALLHWKTMKKGDAPKGVLEGGEEFKHTHRPYHAPFIRYPIKDTVTRHPLWIARAKLGDGLRVGKAGYHLLHGKVACIPFGEKEEMAPYIEVLVMRDYLEEERKRGEELKAEEEKKMEQRKAEGHVGGEFPGHEGEGLKKEGHEGMTPQHEGEGLKREGHFVGQLPRHVGHEGEGLKKGGHEGMTPQHEGEGLKKEGEGFKPERHHIRKEGDTLLPGHVGQVPLHQGMKEGEGEGPKIGGLRRGDTPRPGHVAEAKEEGEGLKKEVLTKEGIKEETKKVGSSNLGQSES